MGAFVWMASVMYAMSGLSNVALGCVLTLLLRHYGVSYTMGGQLVLLQFMGFLVGVSISSLLVRAFGRRWTLVIACLCITIADLVTGALPPLPILAAMCFLNGFGISCTEATIASTIMEWFVGRRAVVMSRLEVAFGVGSVIMPLVTSGFIAINNWTLGFWTVGLLSLLIGLSWFFVPIRPQTRVGEGPRDAPSVAPQVTGIGAKSTLLALFLGIIFMYVGIESCLNNFLPSLFISYVRIGEGTASVTVTVFWISMVIGRALTGWVVRKVPYSPFLLWSIGTTLLLLAALSIWRNAIFAFIVVFLVGLSMSGIFVITMVFANHSFPGHEQRITRLVTAFAGLGGAMVPGLFGWFMDHLSIAKSLWCLTGFTLLLFMMHTAITWMEVVFRRRVPSDVQTVTRRL
jgi:FHS family glucose/mannose:H+ symporter-like MFS transporter